MGAKMGGGGFDDINMTPLIDIVLVVLIIMMVNIPIQVNQLGVKLPSNQPQVELPPDTPLEQLAIAVYEDGRIALNRKVLVKDSSVLLDTASAIEDRDAILFPLFQEVSRRLKAAKKKNVFLDAHPNVNFGIVVDMMDLAREAGAVNVGMAKVKPEGPLPPTSVGEGVMPRGVLLGSPSVVGYINEKKADAAMQPYLPKIRGCYEQGLAEMPTMTGRILARVDLQYEGEIMDSGVDQSSLKSDAVEACVSEVLSTMDFPPLEGTDEKPAYERTARIIYPLLFSPG